MAADTNSNDRYTENEIAEAVNKVAEITLIARSKTYLLSF